MIKNSTKRSFLNQASYSRFVDILFSKEFYYKNMEWHEKAKKIMKERKLTYEKLAESFGVSKSTIGHWMIGKRDPSVRDFHRLAEILGTTTSHLLGEVNYSTSNTKIIAAARLMEGMGADKQDQAVKIIDAIAEHKNSSTN